MPSIFTEAAENTEESTPQTGSLYTDLPCSICISLRIDLVEPPIPTISFLFLHLVCGINYKISLLMQDENAPVSIKNLNSLQPLQNVTIGIPLSLTASLKETVSL